MKALPGHLQCEHGCEFSSAKSCLNTGERVCACCQGACAETDCQECSYERDCLGCQCCKHLHHESACFSEVQEYVEFNIDPSDCSHCKKVKEAENPGASCYDDSPRCKFHMQIIAHDAAEEARLKDWPPGKATAVSTKEMCEHGCQFCTDETCAWEEGVDCTCKVCDGECESCEFCTCQDVCVKCLCCGRIHVGPIEFDDVYDWHKYEASSRLCGLCTERDSDASPACSMSDEDDAESGSEAGAGKKADVRESVCKYHVQLADWHTNQIEKENAVENAKAEAKAAVRAADKAARAKTAAASKAGSNVGDVKTAAASKAGSKVGGEAGGQSGAICHAADNKNEAKTKRTRLQQVSSSEDESPIPKTSSKALVKVNKEVSGDHGSSAKLPKPPVAEKGGGGDGLVVTYDLTMSDDDDCDKFVLAPATKKVARVESDPAGHRAEAKTLGKQAAVLRKAATQAKPERLPVHKEPLSKRLAVTEGQGSLQKPCSSKVAAGNQKPPGMPYPSRPSTKSPAWLAKEARNAAKKNQ